MSELINNREVDVPEQTRRQAMLKEIIKELHAGKSVEEVKARFEEAVGDVTVAEISAMEHSLMTEEGIPVSEVQRLCSVHTAIFKGSIEQIHRSSKPEEQPGHPVHTFKLENREIERLVNFRLDLHAAKFQKNDSEELIFKLLEDLSLLLDLDKHYSRKENLLFPYLEKYGIYGPTKVMWGVDDHIRRMIKEAKAALSSYSGNAADIGVQLTEIIKEVNEMIFKEENILLPMSLDKLTEDEWVKIARESDEIGFCLTAPEQEWIPERAAEPEGAALQGEAVGAAPQEGFIRFETGLLSLHQLETVLNHLPVDLTFIDENDVVRYFHTGRNVSLPELRQLSAARYRTVIRLKVFMWWRSFWKTLRKVVRMLRTSGSTSRINLSISVISLSATRLVGIWVRWSLHRISHLSVHWRGKSVFCQNKWVI